MRLLKQFLFFFIFLSMWSCTKEEVVLPEEEMLSNIGNEIGLLIPDKSKLIQFTQPERVFDLNWVAKIIIPASGYESFNEAVIGKHEDKRNYGPPLADSTDWWKPKDVILRKQYIFDEETLVIIVVSKETNEYAVYIEYALLN